MSFTKLQETLSFLHAMSVSLPNTVNEYAVGCACIYNHEPPGGKMGVKCDPGPPSGAFLSTYTLFLAHIYTQTARQKPTFASSFRQSSAPIMSHIHIPVCANMLLMCRQAPSQLKWHGEISGTPPSRTIQRQAHESGLLRLPGSCVFGREHLHLPTSSPIPGTNNPPASECICALAVRPRLSASAAAMASSLIVLF